MYHDVSYLLSRLINGPLSLRQIYFASSNGPVPDLAYQVDFPRLEIVLEGDAPRDKCTLSCAINGIHAAFHYLKKNYISGCVMTVPTG